LRLDGLLVEGSTRPAKAVESVAADWPKVTLFGHLQFRQPAQGLKPSLIHSLLSSCPSAQNQGMRQFGVIVRQLFFKPAPVRFGISVEKVYEPGCEALASLVDQAVSAQPAQVFVNADQAKGPCARRTKFRNSRERQRKQLSRHHLKAPERRASHAHTQCPDGAAVAVLGALLVKPAAIKAHEVVEPVIPGVERVMKKSAVSGAQGAP